MRPTLFAYHPGRSFPSYSVSGDRCELGCDHCQGQHLRWMRSLDGPESLREQARVLLEDGGVGMLISGGCDQEGRIGIGPYVDAIREAKEETGLLFNLHAGLVDRDDAEALSRSHADLVSLDIHQDPEVISGVLHRPGGPESYRESLEALLDAGLEVVPHLTVGLSRDDPILALDILEGKVSRVVILVLIPTPGTPICDMPMPADEEVLALVEAILDRGMDPVLGCMRPRGNHSLEIECVKRGVRSIALPSRKTLAWAESSGYEIKELPICCALSDRWPLSPGESG